MASLTASLMASPCVPGTQTEGEGGAALLASWTWSRQETDSVKSQRSLRCILEVPPNVDAYLA